MLPHKTGVASATEPLPDRVIRLDQEAHARRLARLEEAGGSPRISGTLSAPRRTVAPKAKKRRIEGHEALIQGLINSGAKVQINYAGHDVPDAGYIRHADRFSISLELVGSPDRVKLIFKHAIESIIAPKTKKEEAEA